MPLRILEIIRRRARARAREAEVVAQTRSEAADYRELFDNAKDAIYVHDLNGTYLSINCAAEKLIGYSREEIIGKNFTDFMTPEYAEQMRAKLKKRLAEKEATTYEVELRARDGRCVPIEVNSRLIYENGIPVAVQGVA